ncbi:DoxX family protein [Microvirga lotononidis]|uniref:Putative membrane protein n=1 Tax=Microvirga lotononidis TaxID=864069 RepID=I4YPV5_9HYPH|nr:DoxX family membrane protein [Microvirga lotononidis]EIM25997.1 putative membrane protein [Microvirga lotononidis]WQO25905.1 DoxX family protein [Microvirga lotononidis]
MSDITVPRLVAQVLSWPAADYMARLALASPFLISGVGKLSDFNGAREEVLELGLRPAALMAAAVIVTQLCGSILFLTQRYCWLGAGILAAFTAVATLLAHPFWGSDGPVRRRQTAIFFEHVAIVGGLAVAALFAHGTEHLQ